ncbi:N-acetylmuramic acid 6-phosphate etherase [Staphylococcus auricularis]|uniref:N-acetylmuramic acid 6-phosphate etherase n=1 Tax=Staphylococcus auricularis TaxID=29379 RepID=A0AAP8PPC9_9STAP|nr:N-acetylmuramic acid 6-phosphate etherase [Staphylococcus auricularis]MBM0867351.1 N-acetylmuramic acid 6-phosphate etherase [Staphylococcus auricularis]MCG7341216.1 N-acetylmuramic acid 6-phosphate etherase [Staphylococcus auricularis]MDC6327625.1 N-acetylmuramic acid 6-phosphate etherase [Staphylococcus auricularis]MDN4533577.1 N-acetylmuramic acid 6-phosphate etherase [Staphylococcus auricularis]PNZ68047.1 N-acetylmuramic acid 6-phosphate etherase [Staphylococcus auricularis]
MKKLTTEARNRATMHLDEMSIYDALKVMNLEDQLVPSLISEHLQTLTEIIKMTTQQFNAGGRIIYMGAGTSGRLGVLDAVECVPTFNVSHDQVIGLIAGGPSAMKEAVEGAEDDPSQGAADLKDLHLEPEDVVIGIAASGQTPYVVGGLNFANDVGAYTVAIACNQDTSIGKLAQYPLEIPVGPEVLTGSTRLKAGSAQKMILNMISTLTMVGAGKVYDNLMVDVKPTNQKLVQRAVHIIEEICEVSQTEAQDLYEAANHDLKVAIVMHMRDCSANEARQRLTAHHGKIKAALKDN